MLCYFKANGIQNRSNFSVSRRRTHIRVTAQLDCSRQTERKVFHSFEGSLSSHCNPKPLVMVQRLRESGIRVGQLQSLYRALSQFCEFRETLNEILPVRLVCGIDDERYLLAERSCRLHGL